MKTKPIKLSQKKDGYGNVSSYTVNIGRLEAIECGFLDKDGQVLPTVKVIDPVNKQIIIKLEE